MDCIEFFPKLNNLLTSKSRDLEEEFTKQILFCLTSSKSETRSTAEKILKEGVSANVISRSSLEKAFRDMSQAQQRGVSSVFKTILSDSNDDTDDSLSRHASSKSSKERYLTGKSRGSTVGKARERVSIKPTIQSNGDLSIFQSKSKEESITAASNNVSLSHQLLNRKKLFSRSDNWPEFPEEPTNPSLLASLCKVWSSSLTLSAISALFPKGGIPKQDNAMAGVKVLSSALITTETNASNNIVLNHLDMIMKWISFSLCARENTIGLQLLLKFITDLLSFIKRCNYILDDIEMGLISHLLEKASIAKVCVSYIHRAFDP